VFYLYSIKEVSLHCPLDILSLEGALKEEQSYFLPTSLPYVIGAHIQSGDEASASEIIKNTDKGALGVAFKTLIENAQKELLHILQDKIRKFN
jgi:hypothetical protein